MKDPSRGKEYDLSIYNIVKYFSLCMDCNPNMIDSLFTSSSCVLFVTSVGSMVRDKRRLFLSKKAWPRFKGYAHQQLHKMGTKNPEVGSKRYEDIQKHGFDTKYAYHLARLIDEVEQILTEGDLDLQRSKEYLKRIRKGEVSEEEIRAFFAAKEKGLEEAYHKSTLPWGPRETEPEIKQLLLDCLEHHYGSLSKCVVLPDAHKLAMQEMIDVVDRHRHLVETGSKDREQQLGNRIESIADDLIEVVGEQDEMPKQLRMIAGDLQSAPEEDEEDFELQNPDSSAEYDAALNAAVEEDKETQRLTKPKPKPYQGPERYRPFRDWPTMEDHWIDRGALDDGGSPK